MFRRFPVLVCLCLLVTILSSGCQPAKKPVPPQTKTDTAKNTPRTELSPSEQRIITSRLSNVANTVDGVSRAIVILSSDNNQDLVVMVGLNLTPEGMKKEQSVKQVVAQKVKSSDERIAKVLVTTDPNMIKRISDVAAGIIEGKPLKSFARDVNELNKNLQQ